jgi:hypothetical protein
LVSDAVVKQWAQLLPGVDFVHSLDTRKWRARCSEPRTELPSLWTDLGAEIAYLIGGNSGEIYPLNDFLLGNLLASAFCTDNPGSWITERLILVRSYLRLIGSQHGLNRLHLSDLWCSIAGKRPAIALSPFAIPETGTQFAQTVLEGFKRRKTKRLWAVILGSGADYRRLEPEDYAAWWLALPVEERPGMVLLGGIGEEKLATRFLNTAGGSSSEILNLAGSCSPAELLGIFDAVDLVMGVDTGPLHWAAAVGTPVLGLYFGEAGFHDTGPYGSGHLVLSPDCPEYPCSPNVANCCGRKCGQAFRKPGAIVELLASLARGETCLDLNLPGLRISLSVWDESGNHYMSQDGETDHAEINMFAGLVRRVLGWKSRGGEESDRPLSERHAHRIQSWCGAWIAQIEQLKMGTSISAARPGEVRAAATQCIRREMDELLSRSNAENENSASERCLLSDEPAVVGA